MISLSLTFTEHCRALIAAFPWSLLTTNMIETSLEPWDIIWILILFSDRARVGSSYSDMTLHFFSSNHNDWKVVFDFCMVYFSFLNQLTQDSSSLMELVHTGDGEWLKIVCLVGICSHSNVRSSSLETTRPIQSRGSWGVFRHVDADKVRVTGLIPTTGNSSLLCF